MKTVACRTPEGLFTRRLLGFICLILFGPKLIYALCKDLPSHLAVNALQACPNVTNNNELEVQYNAARLRKHCCKVPACSLCSTAHPRHVHCTPTSCRPQRHDRSVQPQACGDCISIALTTCSSCTLLLLSKCKLPVLQTLCDSGSPQLCHMPCTAATLPGTNFTTELQSYHKETACNARR